MFIFFFQTKHYDIRSHHSKTHCNQIKRLGNCSFLQGERKVSVLVGTFILFALHVIGVYWWYRNDDLLYPLVMLPPKAIPAFWHAVFIILVNGMDFTNFIVINLALVDVWWTLLDLLQPAFMHLIYMFEMKFNKELRSLFIVAIQNFFYCPQ